MGLHEDDIQCDGRFYVQRTRYTRLGEDFIKDTKTESGERLCILPDPVVKDIKALKGITSNASLLSVVVSGTTIRTSSRIRTVPPTTRTSRCEN